MKQVVSKGIILARTDFGEADRILTILTPDQGKIRAIAKGVRKVKSKLAGGIELFSISQISYIQGKSDIYTLTSTRLEKHFGNIVSDIDRTMYAYEVLKALNRATEDNADGDYFDILAACLEALNDVAIDQPLIQFWFSLQLLELAGQTPNLQTDSTGQKLVAEAAYNFNTDSMVFIKHQQGIYNQQHIKLMRLGIGINSPKALIKINGLDAILPVCLQLTKIMSNQTNH
ncbi:MAG: DNA repair protein RecO [Candidatus Saccharimonadales bacterium]